MAKVRLVDYWAEWCQPCKSMNPIIDEIEKELGEKIEVVRINVDEEPDKASSKGVMSIPTYISINT